VFGEEKKLMTVKHAKQQQQQPLVGVGDRKLDKLERGSNRCVIDLTLIAFTIPL